jgi:hypothetical protein
MDLGENNKDKSSLSDNVAGFEGFDTLTPNDPLATLNATEKAERSQTASTVNSDINMFKNDSASLMTQTQSFIDTQSNKNTLRNKNVRLKNGAIGYVTNSGVFKHYPNMGVLDSTVNKNGCPPKTWTQLNISNTGNVIKTNPELRMGTSMKHNNACGLEGKNIHVVKSDEPGNPEFYGCYNLKSGSKLVYQEDMGNTADFDSCKFRAYDKGSGIFALDSTNGNSKCYIGLPGSRDGLKAGGEAFRVVTSWSYEVPGFKSVKFNDAGELTIHYFDVETGQNKFKVIAKAYPDSANCGGNGGKISLIDATWGLNCNSQNKTWNGQPANYNVPGGNWNYPASFNVSGKRNAEYKIGGFPTTNGKVYADPASGCAKDFRSTYKCGSGPNKQINLAGEAGGKIANYDCTNESNACSGAILVMQNDGNLVMYRRVDNSYKAAWATNTYDKRGVADKSKASSNTLLKRDHLKQGEMLTPGMILGSTTGNCYLSCTTNGIEVNYLVSRCSTVGARNFVTTMEAKYNPGLAFKFYKNQYYNDNISFFRTAVPTNLGRAYDFKNIITATNGLVGNLPVSSEIGIIPNVKVDSSPAIYYVDTNTKTIRVYPSWQVYVSWNQDYAKGVIVAPEYAGYTQGPPMQMKPGDTTIYSVIFEGYFKPNVSGTWKFSTNSDDASYLWIGDNALPEKRTKDNALCKNGGGHGMRNTGDIAVELVADRYYPIAITQGNWGGPHGLEVSFVAPDGVRRYNGKGFYFIKVEAEDVAVAAYSNNTTDLSSINKAAYITDDGKLKEYPSNMVSRANTYHEVGNFSSGGTVLKSIDTTDVNQCKTSCNADANCDGFVFLNGNKCQLKSSDQIYPRQNRIKTNNAKLFKRGYNVKNNDSCTKTVSFTTTNNWNNYEKQGNMDMNTKCNLSDFTSGKQKVLETLTNMDQVTLNPVNDSIKTVSEHIFDSGLNNLALKNTFSSTEENINQNMKESDLVKSQIIRLNILMPTADGMVSESDKLMIRESYRHLSWSILAILIVIGSIKFTK